MNIEPLQSPKPLRLIKPIKPIDRPGRALATAALGVCLAVGSACAQTAWAQTVSMPTPQGPVAFDSASFAYAVLGGPGGSYACFSAGTLSGCTPGQAQAAALGPDLSHGLTLGQGAVLTLAVPAIGSGLALWEAGNFSLTGDAWDTLVSVHTSAGWSTATSVSPGNLAPVLFDTQPSGYQTNLASFSAADFGLPAGSVFDAVRISSCCGLDAHFDLLAVAVVPEPGTGLLFGMGALGLLGLALARRWNPAQPERASRLG
jgi:hypothetical protein